MLGGRDQLSKVAWSLTQPPDRKRAGSLQFPARWLHPRIDLQSYSRSDIKSAEMQNQENSDSINQIADSACEFFRMPSEAD